MSRFFSDKYADLTPYTPGEQPKTGVLVKLNTNESPFPPSKKAVEEGKRALESVNLYPDPEHTLFREKASEVFGVKKENVIVGNGSDEVLNFAFMAFCDEKTPAVFPDITYGFYTVFAKVNGVPYKEIPLKEDFTVDIIDYINEKGTIFLANPNAPTGIALPLEKIEKLLQSDRDRMVVIDEAYVDFGGESCIPLLKKYDNLLVTMTFSKSRSMAGARLGLGIGSEDVIKDLNTLRYSNNPYNVNKTTLAMGYGALCDEVYTKENCKKIIENRAFAVTELNKMGIQTLDSRANFLFMKSERKSGEEIYRKLREKGVLVRHFTSKRIENFNRVTIGDREQTEKFIQAMKEIMEEK